MPLTNMQKASEALRTPATEPRRPAPRGQLGALPLSAVKIMIFLLSLLPLAHLIWGFQNDALGANPIETITRSTGEWTLRFLLITLTITPLRKLSGLHWLIRLRRMVGLFAFFYASLHFTTYIWLDQFFDLHSIAKDILKRPFITVGFAAFVLLVPLAATSFNRAIRALGGKKWQALHRSVYAIAIFGVLHYWWLVKRDITAPFIYALILTALLGLRAWWLEQERRRQLFAPQGAVDFRKKSAKIIPLIPK